MRGFERLWRDPGTALALLALVAAAALYAPTLGRGLVNYDDAWLVQSNWIVSTPSWHSVQSILLDLSRDTRATLGAEYLPVRDLSIMLDGAIWGDSYAGFHGTNLALYLAAIGLWFAAFRAFGVESRVAGLAVLLWAVHPSHAESVAWIAERKGLLAIALSGLVALGYGRFRSGASARWLVLAAVAAIAAVWSKALAAFAIAAVGAIELVWPIQRVSWRRSAVGLGVLATVTAAAFVPVLVVASRMHVVGTETPGGASHGWGAMVLGVHGFYVRLAAMTLPNSITYPISTGGPSTADIVLGAVSLLGLLAIVFVPGLGRWQPPRALRAGAVLWLVGWFPASRILLPVAQVIAADRYLLVPSLGFALLVAVAVCSLERRLAAIALAAALCVSAAARTLDAQASWRDDATLWERATEVNPADGNAWSMYAEALARRGAVDAAERAVETGLTHATAPSLLLRRALLLASRGDREGARTWMERAANAGDPTAMSNLALMLLERGDLQQALVWARKATQIMPLYANGHRIQGKIALAMGNYAEARDAFQRAYELEPRSLANRLNLALALMGVGDLVNARVHLEACRHDPVLGQRARDELSRFPR